MHLKSPFIDCPGCEVAAIAIHLLSKCSVLSCFVVSCLAFPPPLLSPVLLLTTSCCEAVKVGELALHNSSCHLLCHACVWLIPAKNQQTINGFLARYAVTDV